jgi:hypothetical protein
MSPWADTSIAATSSKVEMMQLKEGQDGRPAVVLDEAEATPGPSTEAGQQVVPAAPVRDAARSEITILDKDGSLATLRPVLRHVVSEEQHELLRVITEVRSIISVHLLLYLSKASNSAASVRFSSV